MGVRARVRVRARVKAASYLERSRRTAQYASLALQKLRCNPRGRSRAASMG